MNPEIIERLKKVQQYRGKWQIGDKALYKKYIATIISHEQRDNTIHITYEEIPGVQTYEWVKPNDPDLLWLPPSAPRWPGDDKRNLWDMVDWDMVKPYIHFDGTVTLYRVGLGDQLIVRNAPLPEALLRAIASQGDKS